MLSGYHSWGDMGICGVLVGAGWLAAGWLGLAGCGLARTDWVCLMPRVILLNIMSNFTQYIE